MRNRVTGAVEALMNLLEFRDVKIEAKVEEFSLHLEKKRNTVLRDVTATGQPNKSLFIVYFTGPDVFT